MNRLSFDGVIEVEPLVSAEVGIEGDSQKPAFPRKFAFTEFYGKDLDEFRFICRRVDDFDRTGAFDDEDVSFWSDGNLHGVDKAFSDSVDAEILVSG